MTKVLQYKSLVVDWILSKCMEKFAFLLWPLATNYPYNYYIQELP